MYLISSADYFSVIYIGVGKFRILGGGGGGGVQIPSMRTTSMRRNDVIHVPTRFLINHK